MPHAQLDGVNNIIRKRRSAYFYCLALKHLVSVPSSSRISQEPEQELGGSWLEGQSQELAWLRPRLSGPRHLASSIFQVSHVPPYLLLHCTSRDRYAGETSKQNNSSKHPAQNCWHF